MPVEPEAWAPGKLVAERYFLERHLGAGAMGEVFLANDHLLKKEVALKVLRADLAQNRTIFKRFLREVALAHSVTDPHIVRIYDTGEAHGLPYLSMEYLRGQTLDELVSDAPEDEDTPPMTLDEIRETAAEILGGLQSAHAAGVIHRDLKPANVMLTRRGAIVMDFGVAGFGTLESSPPDPNELDSLVRTEAGTIFGSPAYMAPELWEGAPANVQTDLYAFGVMLYQMLTGRLPYDAPNARVFLEKLKTTKPKPVRSLRKDTPWNLALLVERCMDHDPERRPRSAEAAARLVAPLSRARRAGVIGAVGAVGLFAASTFVLQGQDPWDEQGLPDALALADVHAAVRHYDAGDYPPALTLLDRVEARAPASAGVHFWRALIWHELEDGDARLRGCGEREFKGSELWREMARFACADDFALAPTLRARIEGRGALPEAFLAIAIEHDLVPRLEAVHDAGPALRHEARTAAEALESAPTWQLDEVALPVRWSLARARLELASGEPDAAKKSTEALLMRFPETPATRVYAAWLFTQLGQRERARALADQLLETDPRPALRLALDEGRVRETGVRVDAMHGHPLHASALQLWCGYAFRYEIESPPRRCRALAPGLVRALWAGGAQRADLDAMDPLARGLLDAQSDINMGHCLERPPKVHTLAHVAPPFSTYQRQLEVGAALCAHDPANADRAVAAQLSETLTAMDPGDPWANLIEAQVDLTTGRSSLANSRRNLVAELWAGADPDLPLVARLRDNMGVAGLPRPPRDPAAIQLGFPEPSEDEGDDDDDDISSELDDELATEPDADPPSSALSELKDPFADRLAD